MQSLKEEKNFILFLKERTQYNFFQSRVSTLKILEKEPQTQPRNQSDSPIAEEVEDR